MPLAAGCEYLAYEIDLQLCDLVERFLGRVGVRHKVQAADVLAPLDAPEADVALLLKTAPCLEQQRPGAALEVIDQLAAPHVVISYPTHSLGGRGKGMARTYRAQFERLLAHRSWRCSQLEFATELVFIVDK
jgi:16S rRNA (guanine(1405)-N(7))-methyltransferase